MRHRSIVLSLVATSALSAGCEIVYPESTPDSAVKGEVPVLISNELDADLCYVRATKREGHHFWSVLEDNGYEKPNVANKLAKGATREVRLASTPAMSISADACLGYYPASPIAVDTTHPTILRFVDDKKPAAAPTPTPSGYTEKVLPMKREEARGGGAKPSAPSCLPDGAKRPEATMDFCCHKEYRPGIGQQSAYCGP